VGQRLDVFLSGNIKMLTRSQIQRLIEEGMAKVDGELRKSGYKLREGDRVEIEYEEKAPPEMQPENIPLEIIYSDDHILVLNKPAGMVVHPGAGNFQGTLVNALLYHYPEVKNLGAADRPGLVHRLDKDTSGVMVVARKRDAYIELQRQFRKREVLKTYLGLVWGRLSEKEGRITWAIGRHHKHGLRISVKTNKPREAETRYKVLREFEKFSLLEIRPVTGRTHQIRVHFSAAGHPVVGDVLYGHSQKKVKQPRLFLHAQRLSFSHPATGRRMEFSSLLPPDLEEYLEEIKEREP
jgi:23S rRNA pseudouridine1911/1915/1917 synthase